MAWSDRPRPILVQAGNAEKAGSADRQKKSPASAFFPLAAPADGPYRPYTQRRTDALQTSGGAIAQLVERLNGIQEVRGSTPLGSTINHFVREIFALGSSSCLAAWVILPGFPTSQRPAPRMFAERHSGPRSGLRHLDQAQLYDLRVAELVVPRQGQQDLPAVMVLPMGKTRRLDAIRDRRGWITSRDCVKCCQPTHRALRISEIIWGRLRVALRWHFFDQLHDQPRRR